MTGDQSESGVAQILLAGFSARAVSRVELVAWADATMMRSAEGPPSWLMDLSLSRTDDEATQALRMGAEGALRLGPVAQIYLLTEAARLGRLTTLRTIERAFHVVIYEDVGPPVRDLVYELDDKMEQALREGHDGSRLASTLDELRSLLLEESADVHVVQAVVDACRK